jgi:hypothetical protein
MNVPWSPAGILAHVDSALLPDLWGALVLSHEVSLAWSAVVGRC